MATSPTFREALRLWLKLGLTGFGGPAGQIAMLHTELVERRKWIGERPFLHALNFCMLLPGPEATQLAIYSGWRLHGVRGGIAAGMLFVLPGAVLLWGLSWVYVTYGQVQWIAGIFYGLKPAVTAIVTVAMIRIGRRALRDAGSWALAAGAFVAMFFWRVPFPWIVGLAALIGWVGLRRDDEGATGAVDFGPRETPQPTWARAAKVLVVCGALWLGPVLAAAWLQGWHGTLAQEGIFFSKAAMVTFGGAYAVLPYVGQQAVEHYGWLTAPQMLDGMGLAETTPGPLIMVVQFVGFLGAWHQPGGLSPLLAGTLGAAITTWSTFVPCFLWIFLGAPHFERLQGSVRLSGALAAVTAAVVGVILNLAVSFGGQTFRPPGGAPDWFAVTVALLALAALQRWRIGVVAVVLASGALGCGWSLLR